MKKTNKKIETKQISLYDYHKKLAVFSLIAGIVWMVYGVFNYKFLDVFLDIKDGENWVNLIKIIIMMIFIGGIGVTLLMLAHINCDYKKEKEDELYKENVSKANAKILKVLFFLGELVLIAGIIFLDEKSIEFRFEIVSAIGYLLASTYNFMILHYEKSSGFDGDSEDE